MSEKVPIDSQEPLIEPLLDPKENLKMTQKIQNKLNSMLLHSSEKVSLSDNYVKGRVYANNAPKICLEIITAQTAAIVIAITYIFFIIGFAIDFLSIYESFNSSDLNIPSLSCYSPVVTESYTSSYSACAINSNWNSTVKELSNIISVSLSVSQTNISKALFAENSTVAVSYNVNLWACGSASGCGNAYLPQNYYGSDLNSWQIVFSLTNQLQNIDVKPLLEGSGDTFELQIQLFPNTFQNQEAIPTNGILRSYFVTVEYLETPYNTFTVNDGSSGEDITYNFDVVSRPENVVEDSINVVLLVITIGVLGLYTYIIESQPKKSLPEQKWLIAYFVLLILFQNPVYCVIVWYPQPAIGAAFASYILGYLAQSGLFVLWLMFADSVNRKRKKKRYFYAPKILFGILIFVIAVVVLSFQFPGLAPSSSASTRSAIEAVANWSNSDQQQFVAFSLIYLILLWVWTVLWFFRLYHTRSVLVKLPYMSTRYLQLSYSFFLLQATLVTLYYVLQYAAVIYFISLGAKNVNLENLTDDINTLFRQQTQLFGKTLFLTVYALVLAFLFLPAHLLDNTGLSVTVTATYVISEAEHATVVKARKKAINSIKQNLINQMVIVNQLMSQLINAKADVFCIEIALFLRTISYQAYYDPDTIKTSSAYEGQMDLSQIGFSIIDVHYNADHEAFCIISKEISTGRIVVAFRGTASKKQMQDNLNYKPRAVDFLSEKLTALDNFDGLGVDVGYAESELYPDSDVESVSDGDEVAPEDEENGSKGLGQFSRQSSNSRQNSNSTTHSHESKNQSSNVAENIRDTVIDTVEGVERGVKRAFIGAVGVTNQGINKVVGATTDLVLSAALITPGFKNIVQPHVHSGFWECYLVVRSFIHVILRRELKHNPTTVFFTGHSLGGALATLAALDFNLHSLPRLQAYHRFQSRIKKQTMNSDTIELGLANNGSMDDEEKANRGLFASVARAIVAGFSTSSVEKPPQPVEKRRADSLNIEEISTSTKHEFVRSKSAGVFPPRQNKEEKKTIRFVKKIKVYMYNYGSPRVGNKSFVQLYDRHVPCSYRVVVDGDLVTGIPPSSVYGHVGTYVLIDSLGAGSIIIDPSFVERILRTNLKSSIAVHSLLVYRKGLLGIKLAAEFMQQYANEYLKDDMDPLRLALNTGHLMNKKLKDIVLENDGTLSTLSKLTDTSLLKPTFPVDIGRPEEISVQLPSELSFLESKNDYFSKSLIEEESKNAGNYSVREEKTTIGQSNDNSSMSVQVIGNDRNHFNQRNMDNVHYKHDLEHMKNFMEQMQHSNRGPIDWLREKSRQFNIFSSTTSEKEIVAPLHIVGESTSNDVNSNSNENNLSQVNVTPFTGIGGSDGSNSV